MPTRLIPLLRLRSHCTVRSFTFNNCQNLLTLVLFFRSYNDYMYGDKFLFSYEYVRKCLRDGIELKLVLVKKPTPQPAPETKDLSADYKVRSGGAVVLVCVGSSRVDLQACKLEYSIVSPK